LGEKFSTKTLAGMLPGSCRNIERLKDPAKPVDRSEQNAKAFLNPMVFFLTDQQKSTFEEAIKSAISSGAMGTMAQKKTNAMISIAKSYLKSNNSDVGNSNLP
jgi:hypothetical protein